MANNHAEKFIGKLLIGFSFLIADIFFIFYLLFERPEIHDWYVWAIIAAVVFCTGLYLTCSAFVHKMKNDLIRRQRSRGGSPSSGHE